MANLKNYAVCFELICWDTQVGVGVCYCACVCRCRYCDYKTADSSSLNRHMWRHKEEKPYSCRLCTFSCIQRTQMMAHYKNKHSLAPGDARKLITLVDALYYAL